MKIVLDVSQCTTVATYLQCAVIFSDMSIRNLLPKVAHLRLPDSTPYLVKLWTGVYTGTFLILSSKLVALCAIQHNVSNTLTCLQSVD